MFYQETMYELLSILYNLVFKNTFFSYVSFTLSVTRVTKKSAYIKNSWTLSKLSPH